MFQPVANIFLAYFKTFKLTIGNVFVMNAHEYVLLQTLGLVRDLVLNKLILLFSKDVYNGKKVTAFKKKKTYNRLKCC